MREKACDDVPVPASWEGNGVANHQSNKCLTDVLAPANVSEGTQLLVCEEETIAVLYGMTHNT